MLVFKVILLSLMLLVKYARNGYCNCILSLDTDFGHPSPVYLQNGDFLSPSYRGNVTVRRGGAVTVACPGDKRYIVLGNDTTHFEDVEAVCVSSNKFSVGKWLGQFKEIRCNGQPWFSSEAVGICHERSKLYRVGYKIHGNLYSLYEACFNPELVSTWYVKHYVSPVSKHSQGGGNRPQFIEGGLFGKVRMSELYKNVNQKTRLNALLGDGMDQEYMSKNQFLTRGHLAPKADFSLRAEQRASFHYVNTAPQWMRNNAGDWAALEEAIRRRTHALNHTVTVYTGTLGVFSLPNHSGADTEIYLTDDANNNRIVPVPMYFFKLVHSPTFKTATAFITINSSFYNRTITDKLTFCNDVCDDSKEFGWLRWRADGAKSFCCSYQEFVEEVPYLPRLDVTGLFY